VVQTKPMVVKMKIKELIQALSNYNLDSDVEIMYTFYTPSADGKSVKVTITDKKIHIVPSYNIDIVDSILLATELSLID
jgi:hypothetical protein